MHYYVLHCYTIIVIIALAQAIITHYTHFIIMYHYIIITILLYHYYIIITSLLHHYYI